MGEKNKWGPAIRVFGKLKPGDLESLSEAFREKQILDMEAYKWPGGSRKMNSNEKSEFNRMLNQRNSAQDNIARLRYRLAEVNPLSSEKMILDNEIMREVNRYNEARKRTWNPTYGGLGLLNYDGTEGGVSFNKF